MITKQCRICNIEKSLIDFHKCSDEKIINGKMYPIKYRSECKMCRRVGGKAHSSAAKKIMDKDKIKRPILGTPCDNCGKNDQKLIFDHCHETNKFRGWLCYQCNTAIGNLGDNIDGLQRAINYLNNAKKIG